MDNSLIKNELLNSDELSEFIYNSGLKSKEIGCYRSHYNI